MSQQIKVEAVTKEPRSYKGALNWGVKLPGDGGWVTLYREKKPERGEIIDVNVTERRGNNGQSYKDCFPVMPALAAPSANSTQPQPAPVEAAKPPKQITWDDYREVMKAAHNVALVLEPDTYNEHVDREGGRAPELVDRSRARAAIMNTVLIAFGDKRFIVPKEDDEYVAPPEDDDIPPF